jgi:hypothetical protein
MTTHELIDRLNAAGIKFSLTTVRDDAVMFEIAVPGQRWEAEVFADNRIELERFISSGEIEDEPVLLTLINEYKD